MTEENQNSPGNSAAWNPDAPIAQRFEAAVELIRNAFPQVVILGLPDVTGKLPGSGIFASWKGDSSSIAGWILGWFTSQLVMQMNQAVMGGDEIDALFDSQGQEKVSEEDELVGEGGRIQDAVPSSEAQSSQAPSAQAQVGPKGLSENTKVLSDEERGSLQARPDA